MGPDRCKLLQAPYSWRAVRALDLQIVGGQYSTTDPDFRIIDVMYTAAALADLPDLSIREPNVRAGLPAFEMARNLLSEIWRLTETNAAS